MVRPCPPLVPLGTSPEFCQTCYAPLERDDEGQRSENCWACRRNFSVLDGHVSITYHTRSRNFPLGSNIHFAKAVPERRNIGRIGNVLHQWLDMNWSKVASAWRPSAVTYVPSHPAKVATRGFDFLAEVIEVDPVQKARIGIRPMLQQLSPDEQPAEHRLADPDAWGIMPGTTVSGVTVMVIDDVMTSGATLAGIARKLRRGGATAVYGLTITRAVSKAAEADLMEILAGVPFDWNACELRAG